MPEIGRFGGFAEESYLAAGTVSLLASSASVLSEVSFDRVFPVEARIFAVSASLGMLNEGCCIRDFRSGAFGGSVE